MKSSSKEVLKMFSVKKLGVTDENTHRKDGPKLSKKLPLIGCDFIALQSSFHCLVVAIEVHKLLKGREDVEC